jgi:calcineurin-like phosphoesterase
MTGPYESVIGVDSQIILQKFTKGIPMKFEVATGIAQFNAVYIEIEENKGRTTLIERISRLVEV